MTAASSVPAERAQAILTIDLTALQANWRFLRQMVSPAACAAVIKADAYGTGLEQAAVALRDAGCEVFFVAQIDEGLRARAALGAALPSLQIFVLNGLAASAPHARACADAGLIPMIGCEDDATLWAAQAQRVGQRLPVALMFDTGMNRLGYDWRAALQVANWFAEAPSLKPVLAASHFTSSEAPANAANAAQIARFEDVRRAAFPTVPASLANSSGIYLPERPFFNLVRPGYALYGGNPTPNQPNPMRPVVRLRARILQIRNIEAGETVGYNGQWTARRQTRLAAIGVGYADGLPRNAMATDARPGGEAIVAGLRCPFAGRVSMDLTTIDVTDVPEDALALGMTVELLGESITVDELGARAGTIGYEILTGLGTRYAREYAEAGARGRPE